MVAAGASGVVVQSWGAAELAGGDHQRVVHHATFGQVVEQCRVALFVGRHLFSQTREDLGVMVPAVTDVSLDGHKPDARLDQATGQQQALPHPVASVGGSQRIGFLCQVERVLGLL